MVDLVGLGYKNWTHVHVCARLPYEKGMLTRLIDMKNEIDSVRVSLTLATCV